MGKDKYYVVLVGRHPGIYRTWDDARVQVEGFSGCRHRAFRNWNEAMAYWENYFSKTSQPSRPLTETPYVEVAATSVEMDIHHATTSSIRQTSQPSTELVNRATSTDDLGPSESERVMAILIGVLVIFFALLIIIKF